MNKEKEKDVELSRACLRLYNNELHHLIIDCAKTRDSKFLRIKQLINTDRSFYKLFMPEFLNK